MAPHHREDESLEEIQVKIDQRISPFRIFVGLIAVLLILAGIVWAGQMIGLLTAVLPAGPGFFEGWLWGCWGCSGWSSWRLSYGAPVEGPSHSESRLLGNS